MAAFFSGVYGPRGTKLGGKVEGMWEEFNRPLVSMVTKLLLSKLKKRSHDSHIGLMERGEIFAAFFSAVYGPIGTKLGRKEEG